MTETPTLKEMGIKNSDEIAHYKLYMEGHADILKIFYQRQKGSFLPLTRKYKFGRSVKAVAHSGSQEQHDIYEISPFLQKAIAELDTIVDLKANAFNNKKEIIEEMYSLEKSFNSKMEELRRRIEQL